MTIYQMLHVLRRDKYFFRLLYGEDRPDDRNPTLCVSIRENGRYTCEELQLPVRRTGDLIVSHES